MSNHILVVDDDPQIVRILQTYLTQAGLRVLTAGDGDEALRSIRRERPACLVLDLMMPGRNGWDLTRLLRNDQQLAHIPILMLSAPRMATRFWAWNWAPMIMLQNLSTHAKSVHGCRRCCAARRANGLSRQLCTKFVVCAWTAKRARSAWMSNRWN